MLSQHFDVFLIPSLPYLRNEALHLALIVDDLLHVIDGTGSHPVIDVYAYYQLRVVPHCQEDINDS